MEKSINTKIQDSINVFKSDFRIFMEKSKQQQNQQYDVMCSHIIDFVKNYDIASITKEDFVKRKRLKNVVPYYDRCIAKIANNEQCTRRKKSENVYCGTHLKGLPHGVIHKYDLNLNEYKKITVTAKDINGIFYYIDENFNVYDTNDIMNGTKNPKIVAHYEIVDGEYCIPSFDSLS